jgi:hypothetical protein
MTKRPATFGKPAHMSLHTLVHSLVVRIAVAPSLKLRPTHFADKLPRGGRSFPARRSDRHRGYPGQRPLLRLKRGPRDDMRLHTTDGPVPEKLRWVYPCHGCLGEERSRPAQRGYLPRESNPRSIRECVRLNRRQGLSLWRRWTRFDIRRGRGAATSVLARITGR